MNSMTVIFMLNLFTISACNINIHELVSNGDINKVKELINKCPEKINSTEKGVSATPLHVAALYGNTTLIKVFIDNGADVNALDVHDNKPIHHASRNLHKEAIEILVENGSDIPPRIIANVIYPLRMTFKINDRYIPGPDKTGKDKEIIKEIISYFLDHGVDINYGTGPYNTTSIFLVNSGGYGIDMMRFYRDNGADFKVGDDHNATLMHHANGNKELIEFLLNQGLDINAKDYQGRTPLHYEAASVNGDIESMKALIDAGANVNEYDQFSFFTPLNDAIYSNKKLTVEFLLKNGADVNITRERFPVLHIAARQKCISNSNDNIPDIIHLLIEYGADINDVDRTGDTALHEAAYCGNIDAALIFIEKGIEINKRNESGKTALGVAIEKEKHQIAKIIRKHGGIE